MALTLKVFALGPNCTLSPSLILTKFSGGRCIEDVGVNLSYEALPVHNRMYVPFFFRREPVLLRTCVVGYVAACTSLPGPPNGGCGSSTQSCFADRCASSLASPVPPSGGGHAALIPRMRDLSVSSGVSDSSFAPLPGLPIGRGGCGVRSYA